MHLIVWIAAGCLAGLCAWLLRPVHPLAPPPVRIPPAPDAPPSPSAPAVVEIATRDSWWRVLPLPKSREDLGFAQSYTHEAFERIKRGVIPEVLDEKWFVFYEEPWLYLHHSWTGECLYGVRLLPSDSGVASVESWVNRDTELYQEWSVEDHRLRLTWVIEGTVLGRRA